MIPDQKFNCPRCGAPGQTTGGVAEYSCGCRFIGIPPLPTAPAQVPVLPIPVLPIWSAATGLVPDIHLPHDGNGSPI